MTISREYLVATLENLRQQESEASVMVERARGAILLTEALIEQLDKPSAEKESEESIG
jgi:hypothetical protein